MTHRYIGTKEVTAWAAEKDGKPGYGVKYEDGYTSWSPKEVFEDAYRTSEPGMPQNLTFGDALHYLKQGKKVARTGWNGKCMWLALIAGENWGIGGQAPYDISGGAHINHASFIGMRTADCKFVPWLASQTDMLANDWMVM